MCQISFVPCKISFCLNWAQELATKPCSQPGDCKPTYHPLETYTGFEYCARCQKALEATTPRPRYPFIRDDSDPSKFPSITEPTQDAEEHDAGKFRIGFSPSSSPNIAMGREREYYYPPTAEERAFDDEVRKADRARRIEDEEPNRLIIGLDTPPPSSPPSSPPRPPAIPKTEPVYRPYRPAAVRPPSPYPVQTNERPAYTRPVYQRPVYVRSDESKFNVSKSVDPQQQPVYIRPDDDEADASESPDLTPGKDDGLGLRGGDLIDSIVDMYAMDSTVVEGLGLQDESEIDNIVEMYMHL